MRKTIVMICLMKMKENMIMQIHLLTINMVKRNYRSNRDCMTNDEYHGYLKGNVLKYVSRYKFKGEPLEDLQKANWYLNRLIKEVSNGQVKQAIIEVEDFVVAV